MTLGERAAPAVLRLAGPEGATSSLSTVALIDELRRRGYRVGTAARRAAGLGLPAATVLVLGGGARVTLEGTLGLEALAVRALSLDPGLDVLLVEGQERDEGDAGDADATVFASPLVALPEVAPGSEAARVLADEVESTYLGPHASIAAPPEVALDTPRRLLDRSDFPVAGVDTPDARSAGRRIGNLLRRLRG